MSRTRAKEVSPRGLSLAGRFSGWLHAGGEAERGGSGETADGWADANGAGADDQRVVGTEEQPEDPQMWQVRRQMQEPRQPRNPQRGRRQRPERSIYFKSSESALRARNAWEDAGKSRIR
jgi:hypothetical protein